MVRFDSFKGIPENRGWCFMTGHRKTLAKMPNNILIALADQGKTWVSKYYKLISRLKKIVYEKRL